MVSVCLFLISRILEFNELLLLNIFFSEPRHLTVFLGFGGLSEFWCPQTLVTREATCKREGGEEKGENG